VKLYFARHGESTANVQQIFWGRTDGYGLTARGVEQAKMLADSISDVRLAAIYCSPLFRAVQTAQIVSGRLEVIYEIDEGLREWDTGILDGQKYSEATWDIHDRVIRQWIERNNPDARIKDGESRNDIKARFMPLISRLKKTYSHTNVSVLLISHTITLTSMLPLLLANINETFCMVHGASYAAPIVAELRGDEWVCLQWGEKAVEGEHQTLLGQQGTNRGTAIYDTGRIHAAQ
jgi:broad specificity phosphatase PhoE